MKISEIYGKKVESTAGKTGYVVSVCVNEGRLECFLCADEDENEFAVDVKTVLSIGNKILYEDRESAIKTAKPLRLGRAGFDAQGNYVGILEDLTLSGNRLLKAKIGKKNYALTQLSIGDAIIVSDAKRVKYDVKKDGKIIIKKGTPITGEVLEAAEAQGEYVQTNLKSI